MKRLLKYLDGYQKETILAPLFKLMEALMDLMVPLIVANIINIGIAGGRKGYITGQFGLMIGLAIAGLAFSFTAQYFAAKASVGAATKIRQALYDHIQSFSYTELDTIGSSTLITRLTSDVNQVQSGINMALRLFLRSPFIVFGSMIIAFTIDVKCALIFAVAIPILSVVVYGIMVLTIPLFKKVQRSLDRVTDVTRENLTGVRVIRAFRKEESEIAQFDQINETLTKNNEFVGRISALMNPLTYLLINLATIFLIQRGAIQVNIGAIQQGDVVALYNYMAQMIVELIKLAALLATIDKSIACAGRVADVLDMEPGMTYSGEKTAKEEASCAVRFENVSFSYKNSGEASVLNLNFEVKKGETIGIIGGTGAGKTTLVNLIPRFYDATEGSVFVDGIDVKEYAEGELIQKIGIVPQKAMLFKGTIRDNLKWGNENASDEELWQAIDTAQAHDVVEEKEGKLSYQIEQNGRNLSGGQKQRLTIARALVKKPKILILDDSASALDFATDAALRKAIHNLPGDLTVFLVSQRASSIRNADKILVLNDGEITGIGTHEELMKSCSIYQEIYFSQFPEEAARGQEVTA